MLCTQGITDHNGIISSFRGEEVIQCSQMGMTAVTDDLTVNIADAQRGSDQSGLSVMIRRHAIVYMLSLIHILPDPLRIR